jgi:hypothetical protein
MNSSLSPVRSPCLTLSAFQIIPSPTTLPRPVVAFARYPSARLTSGISPVRASPLHCRLAAWQGRIEFVILRTDRSPPAALHAASRPRSCIRLQAGERMLEGDFHPSDSKRAQAHSAATCRRFSSVRFLRQKEKRRQVAALQNRGGIAFFQRIPPVSVDNLSISNPEERSE